MRGAVNPWTQNSMDYLIIKFVLFQRNIKLKGRLLFPLPYWSLKRLDDIFPEDILNLFLYTRNFLAVIISVSTLCFPIDGTELNKTS